MFIRKFNKNNSELSPYKFKEPINHVRIVGVTEPDPRFVSKPVRLPYSWSDDSQDKLIESSISVYVEADGVDVPTPAVGCLGRTAVQIFDDLIAQKLHGEIPAGSDFTMSQVIGLLQEDPRSTNY